MPYDNDDDNNSVPYTSEELNEMDHTHAFVVQYDREDSRVKLAPSYKGSVVINIGLDELKRIVTELERDNQKWHIF